MLVPATVRPSKSFSATIITVPPESPPTPKNKTDLLAQPFPTLDKMGRRLDKNVPPQTRRIRLPASLSSYYRNAPIKKLRHPLEENIFSSLLITLFAIAVALLIGTPLLMGVGLVLLLALGFRYLLATLHGLTGYVRFICSNRTHPTSRSQPPLILPRDMALANDIRWLAGKKRSRCQSLLHTLLVFEGSIELQTFQHLVQTRVLRAETPEGELLYPRLLQRVRPVLGGYLWELDLSFDIRNHVQCGPAHFREESELQVYLGRLLQQPLSLSRPLWEIRLLPSYYGGGKDTLAIVRVHQCLSDGMSLIRILSHALADHQQMHIPQRPHFAGMSYGFNVLRSLIVGPVTIFLWWFATFRDRTLFTLPLPKLRKRRPRRRLPFSRRLEEEDTYSFSSSIGSSSSSPPSSSTSPTKEDAPPPPPGKGVGVLLKKYRKRCKRRKRGRRHKRRILSRKKRRKSASSLSLSSRGSVSSYSSSLPPPSRPPSWNVCWSAPLSLPKVARIKQIMRSSYNDVLLSALAGSLRSYLQSQGIPYPGDLQVLIPIDLRNDLTSPKCSPRLGSKLASVLATVPVGSESAIPRLWATRHRLDELKSSADSVVAYGATTILMNVLPHGLALPLLDTISNKASLQFSNLPGPTYTTVIGGYALKGIYPILPPPGSLRLGVSVITYADQVHITVVSHRSLRNAGPKLLRGMTEEVDQLSKQLSQRRVPGESRRSARNFHQQNNAEIAKPPTRQIHIQLQSVQEELAQLNTRLESEGIHLSEEDWLPLPSSSQAPAQIQIQPTTPAPQLSLELQHRLHSLKQEFAELIGELRRRSSIVEGVAMSFEEEGEEEEYRKPRKRALSVVSMTRRSSIFSSRSNQNCPESPSYSSSDEDLPSSPQVDSSSRSGGLRPPGPGSSSMRTTAV